VIASSSSKGSGAVDEGSDPDPYNLPNNLAMYSSHTDQGSFPFFQLGQELTQYPPVQYLNKHSRTFDRAGGKAIKYYAVSNVAMDSTRCESNDHMNSPIREGSRPDHFYSVGQDKCLRQWKVSAENCIEVAKSRWMVSKPLH
jgi:hypothetical protein